MKTLVLTLAVALLASPAFARDEGIPEDLHEADYITAVDVEAEVPYGDLYIDQAVIAIFPRLENRLSGMLVGRVRLKMRRMPAGSAPAAEGGDTRPRPIEFKIEQAYLSCSLHSDVKVLPKGRALQARRWDGLEQEERDQFLALYLEALPDSWHEPALADGTADERDPRGKEFFTAFWAKPPRSGEPNPSSEAARFDYRVKETGAEVMLEDRSNHGILFQLPPPAETTGTAPSGTSP